MLALDYGRMLPRILGEFKSAYPEVRQRLVVANSEAIQQRVSEQMLVYEYKAGIYTNQLQDYDKANAIADINFIRANSGGLAASGLTVLSTDAQFIDELLLQRRYSLLWEGHRWIDVRRFGRLLTLPKDLPSHFIHEQQPIPQAECLFRAPLEEPPFRLLGPGTEGGGLRDKNVTAVHGRVSAGQPWVGSFGGGPQLAEQLQYVRRID